MENEINVARAYEKLCAEAIKVGLKLIPETSMFRLESYGYTWKFYSLSQVEAFISGFTAAQHKKEIL